MQLNKSLQKYGMLIVFNVVFWTLFIGALIQGWAAFSVLLLPLLQYLLYIWFKILEILKTPCYVASYQVESITLGNLDKNSSYFYYCALVDQLLIIAMGIESYYHPQLVNTHFVLYLIPIGLVFISSTMFTMNSLVSEAQILLLNENEEVATIWLDSSQKKIIKQNSLLITVILSVVWIGFSILAHFQIFAFTIVIPGSTEKLFVSYILILILILSIAHSIVLFYFVHTLIIKNSITYLKNTNITGRSIYLKLIRNYILVHRLYIA